MSEQFTPGWATRLVQEGAAGEPQLAAAHAAERPFDGAMCDADHVLEEAVDT
ncbi:MAG: hypothetical protein GY953_14425, partial [bacterium]|nr:hypothetical protein [bacterium]